MEFEVRDKEARTEKIFVRVTPAEKLKILKEARKPKYKGSVSNVLRGVLADTLNDNRSGSDRQALTGAIVSN